MLGPVVGAVFFLLLRWLLRDVETANARPRRLMRALEICRIVLITINSMGNAIHLFFNAVNTIDSSRGLGAGAYNGIDVAGFFLFIWFMDKWGGGPYFVMVRFFGYLVVAARVGYLPGPPAPHGRAAACLSRSWERLLPSWTVTWLS